MITVTVLITDNSEPDSVETMADYAANGYNAQHTAGEFVAPSDSSWRPILVAMASVLERQYGYKFNAFRDFMGDEGRLFDWDNPDDF